MTARKKIFNIENPENQLFRDKVKEKAKSEKACNAMLKDMLLVEAALSSDKIVAARDRTVINFFEEISENIGEFREIYWINPCKNTEEVLEWLKEVARVQF